MFLYRIGFAPSVNGAEEWITKGYVYINNKPEHNIYKPIKLYDFLTFVPFLW
jgi:ribosomal protein S4